MISVARLFLGFSNSSNEGKAPKKPVEVRYNTTDNNIAGLSITNQREKTFCFMEVTFIIILRFQSLSQSPLHQEVAQFLTDYHVS